MKFPQFQYVRPASLPDALALLGRYEGGAVPLAGGQSLLAGLSMRIAAPECLVDIGGLDELKGIALAGDGATLRIGALTRHVELMRSPLVERHAPLLREAIGYVGHAAIRNRGTFGGSLAYSDPAAEMPACTVALGGVVVVAGPNGLREIAAGDFFRGLLETALETGELIVEVRFPVRGEGELHAVAELSRRAGDFALAGLAVQATVQDARIRQARVVYFGCTDRPRVAPRVSALLAGRPVPLPADPGDLGGVDDAVAADIDPTDTPGCSAATRRQLAVTLTRRALATLNQRMPQ
ncbi:xanthine dehydrogenase family protein subunit M [Pigmentiphaga soli]|uniref:Xanthine dehydrogenase family protein subunit M n=1 Tax=Pigmentiphaga soli TaxID=1007095 RepID=A0ABP8H3P4_9BURK